MVFSLFWFSSPNDFNQLVTPSPSVLSIFYADHLVKGIVGMEASKPRKRTFNRDRGIDSFY